MAAKRPPKPPPTLARRDAEIYLSRSIEAAKRINADPQRYPYAVRRLFVFGSFLTDKDPLGDLDLAADFVGVRSFRELLHERPEWQWGMKWHLRSITTLRVRKPGVVNIVLFEEMLTLQCPYRMVFDDPNVRHHSAQRPGKQ